MIDDFDSVISDDDDSVVDYEKRNALNAITSVIDTLHSKMFSNTESFPVFILGFCSNIESMPASLVKVGRFEKIISMFPPTEKQRQQILDDMIHSLPIHTPEMDENEARTKWSRVIAQYTGGCVASDLKSICIDALTRSMARSKANSLEVRRVLWDDMKEATRNCVPSQLAQLDVTLTRDIDDVHNTKYNSLKDEFLASFQCFGGYDELKAKIYRTVILPWKRRNSTPELSTASISSLKGIPSPPTGVLFHGPSGTGKTFAAECLASALRLNVIRVSTIGVVEFMRSRVSFFLTLSILRYDRQIFLTNGLVDLKQQ
jgi:transitional endoplasmic reticulum ATPase